MSTPSNEELDQATQDIYTYGVFIKNWVENAAADTVTPEGTAIKNLFKLVSEIAGSGADMFVDTTEGLANTVDGDLFLIQGSGNVYGYLYKNVAGVATDQSLAIPSVAALTLKADLADPTFTGIPAAPTATPGTNTTQIATTAFVAAAVAALLDSAPGTLDTLNELAAALGDDPNFSTTITNLIALKAPLADPALTGTPTAPTATSGTNTTQIATTAFVTAAVAALINSAPGTLDTLDELAAALGDDENFAATVTASLAAKAPLADPALTGTPTAPTAAVGTNTTQISTTAFVQAAIAYLLVANSHVNIFAESEIVVDEDALTITFPLMRVRTYATGEVNVNGGTFTLSEDNSDNVFYYIDTTSTDGSGRYSILTQSTDTGLQNNPDKLWLGSSAYKRFNATQTGWRVVYQSDLDAMAAVENNTRWNIYLHSGSEVIYVDEDAATVSIPRLHVEDPINGVFYVAGDDPTVLSLPNATTPHTFYYVDLAEGATADRIKSTTTLATALSSETIVLFGWATFTNFNTVNGLRVEYSSDSTTLDDARYFLDYEQPTNVVVRTNELRMALEEAVPTIGQTLYEDYDIFSANGRLELQPPIPELMHYCAANGATGLSYLTDRVAHIAGAGNFSVFAGHGRTFHGQGTANMMSISGGGYVQCRKLGSAIAPCVSAGVTPVYTTESVTPTGVFAVGGQSHGVAVYNKGLEGIGRALHDSSLDSHVAEDWAFLNISHGGTGVVMPEGASFWDPSAGTPSALGYAKGQIIDDAVTAGWPRPMAFSFDCGDADRLAFTSNNPLTGVPYTVAELSVFVLNWLDYLKSKCHADAICTMVVLGAAESDTTDSVDPVYSTASREAYLRAAELRSWVHVVQSKANRTRPRFDPHMNALGAYRHGYNIGRVAGRAINAAVDQFYVEVSAVTYTAGGAEAIVTLSAASGKSVILPEPPISPNIYPGPFPLGLGIIGGGAGGNAVDDMIELSHAELLVDGRLKLYPVSSSADVRNGKVITLAGWETDAIGGYYISDNTVEDACTGRGILPERITINTAE